MFLRFLIVAVFATTLSAQAPPTGPAPEEPVAAPAMEHPKVDPETPVVVIDGVGVTARMLNAFVESGAQQLVPPELRAELMKDRKEAALYLGILLKMMRLAEEKKLHEEPVMRDSLANFEKVVRQEADERTDKDYKKNSEIHLQLSRAFTLATAYMRDLTESTKVSDEEIREHYQNNLDQYTEAKVKVLYVPFASESGAIEDEKGNALPSEAEARKVMEEIQAKLAQGTDFVELLKQYSRHERSRDQGGDGTLRKGQSLPPEAQTVFGLKPGEVSPIVRWTKGSTGFYLFRLEEINTKSFDEVRAQIWTDIKDQRNRELLQKMRGQIDLRILSPEYFAKPENA